MRILIVGLLAAMCSHAALSQATPAPTPTTTLTPQQIEELKQKRDRALKINDLITRTMTAMNAKDWPTAVDLAKQLVALDQSPDYYRALADSELNLGSYDDAIAAYKTCLSLMGSHDAIKNGDEKTRRKAAAALTNLGNSYLKQKKNDDAVKSYEAAAELDPDPATAYFNICATAYNAGDIDHALKACDKAIAADPKKADAWFIKGSLLFANSNQDKDGKTVAPQGAVDALKKYLELAPQGPHAADVKQMLDYLGVKY